VLSRKALVRGVTRVSSEAVPDADGPSLFREGHHHDPPVGRAPLSAHEAEGLQTRDHPRRRALAKRLLLGELDSEQRPADDQIGTIASWESDHGTRPTRATPPR
jgi:hypothetical protein